MLKNGTFFFFVVHNFPYSNCTDSCRGHSSCAVTASPHKQSARFFLAHSLPPAAEKPRDSEKCRRGLRDRQGLHDSKLQALTPSDMCPKSRRAEGQAGRRAGGRAGGRGPQNLHSPRLPRDIAEESHEKSERSKDGLILPVMRLRGLVWIMLHDGWGFGVGGRLNP